jgi:succinoglycan biosynthesis protein ExoV
VILHHWRPASRDGTVVTNFGDELNTVLWPRLLGPSFFDDDDRVEFLGIGSLLGWPKNSGGGRRHRVVFGTGAAFADSAPREPRDDTWRIYCVRGPLTAQAYQLDAALAVADPAILLAKFHRRVEPEIRFGYMPHLDDATRFASVLARACADMGVRYIDPRGDVDDVITAVGSVAVLVAEAMHGAIAADALRVPWIPVFTALRPHRFKWTDWCRSMQLEFDPHRIVNASSWGGRVGIRGAYLDGIAARLFRAQLGHVTRQGRPLLSAAPVQAEKLERLEAAIAELQADVRAGRFAANLAG